MAHSSPPAFVTSNTWVEDRSRPSGDQPTYERPTISAALIYVQSGQVESELAHKCTDLLFRYKRFELEDPIFGPIYTAAIVSFDFSCRFVLR
jgi:hypothetical protein